MAREIREIAKDVRADWKNVNFAARPYLNAMDHLVECSDYYGQDDAKGIVVYFLSNASTWRGKVAQSVKAELKQMFRIK